ncbi:MAG: hypothetical protein HZB37_01690 [Planctomycetes bacterium]|nr:hypothetical protein [Planctomycetota bacterium]
MKNMYLVVIFLFLTAFLCGCANHLGALNNSSSITVERGLGAGVGADPFTLAPRAYFNMGTNARIGKHDRIVITVNKDATIITAENLNYEANYDEQGRLVHEIRGKDIRVEEPSGSGIGTRTTYLRGELKGPIKYKHTDKGLFRCQTDEIEGSNGEE